MSKDTPRDDCEKCGGIGKIEPEHEFPDGTMLIQPGFIKTCPACHGTGKRREGR